ncbi:MAG: hypothetical protein MK165_21630 [Pirellulaceae bacterium]|nr:hypothetical protein [Pirellulaceae bacterium]
MSIPMTAPEVLDREFLELRAKILELASSFDRFGRASGSVTSDPRLERLHEALDVLKDTNDDRAQQVQLIFSRPYEDDWREKYGL